MGSAEGEIGAVGDGIGQPETFDHATEDRAQLISYLAAHLGHKPTEAKAQSLVERLVVGGHLVIGDKGVAYQL